MEISNEFLIKLRNKDQQALKDFYIAYKDKIYNFLLIKTGGNVNAAEEVFSETVYSILKSVPSIKNVKNINSWVLQIASRRLYDYINKNKKNENNAEFMDEIEIPKDNNNEQKEEMNERLLMTKMAMEDLKPELREILNLKYTDDLSQKEIAAKLNKTELAVQGLLFRAREALKKELKKRLKDFE